MGGPLESVAGALWDRLDDHPLGMKFVMGMVFGAVRLARHAQKRGGGSMNQGLLSQIRALAENLNRMGRVLMPDIAVIDGFVAMEGEGPGGGTPVSMKFAVAGTDPIACDALAAYLMGFDPLSVGYLAIADESGLGVADLSQIDVLGETPESLRHPVRRHSNDAAHMRWREAW